MADTSLKFGPEWLRALSSGGNSSVMSPPPSPSVPKYKPPNYRYGREEMLTMFDKTLHPPDETPKYSGLFVDKAQFPVALSHMTDEEMRTWQRCVNSDAVLRAMGRGTSSSAPPRGRGGSVERGRGRMRGTGAGLYYNRTTSFDEESDGRRDSGAPPGGFSRGSGIGRSAFERSQSVHDRDRGWTERNGIDEWNSSGNNRKEFSRAPVDNWRAREARERERDGREEDDGWRTSGRGDKWSARTGWRESSQRERDRDLDEDWERDGGEANGDYDHADSGAGHHDRGSKGDRKWRDTWNGTSSSSRGGGGVGRRGWDDGDQLPEWAMDEPGEGGGTFDAAGAFHRGVASREGRNSSPLKSDHSAKPAVVPVPSSQKEEMSESVSDKPDTVSTEKKISELNRSEEKEPSSQSFTSGIGRGRGKIRVDAAPVPVPGACSTENVMPQTNVHEEVSSNQRVEDDSMDHLEEVADKLVANLMEEEDVVRESPDGANESVTDSTKWFYRDPQGEIQGPFSGSEMADWFSSGYFLKTLMVRRDCDERFAQLGELMEAWGRVPFLPGTPVPPLKNESQTPPPDPKLLLLQQQLQQQQQQQQLQQQQQQLLHQQMMQQAFVRQQVRAQSIVNKLMQSDGWGNLTHAQQQQVITHHLLTDSLSNNLVPIPSPPPQLGSIPVPLALVNDALSQQARLQAEQQTKIQTDMLQQKNILPALLAQLKQAKPNLPPDQTASGSATQVDNFQQLLQQLNIPVGKSPTQSPVPQGPSGSEDDPLRYMRHVHTQSNPQQLGETTVWPPGEPGSSFGPRMPPPIPMPTSVWDMEMKDNVRWQEQLEEQIRMHQQKQEEERRIQEDIRKQKEQEAKAHEEELRKAEEQELLRQRAAEEEHRRMELFRKEEERRLREEEERRRIEEEERIQREEIERLRREEEERRRRMEEEELERRRRILEEEERRRKLMEEEQQRQKLIMEEQERKRREEELLHQQEEQRRRALLEQQQQQQQLAAKLNHTPAPWANQNALQSMSDGRQSGPSEEAMSLAEIQRIQEEKERQERLQQQQLLAAQHARDLQQRKAAEAAQAKLRRNLPMTWAQKPSQLTSPVKSLAEIQAEEQEQEMLSREREMAEKEQRKAQQSHLTLAAAGVWGTTSQSRSWASRASSGQNLNQMTQGIPTTNTNTWWDASWNNMNSNANVAGSGFWDEPSVPSAPLSKPQQTAPQGKGTSNKSKKESSKAANSNSKSTNSSRSRMEESAMKLFEPEDDKFTLWCIKELKEMKGLPASLDGPTFINFLKEVESPYEVQDYVCSYLGDNRKNREFVQKFLEKRSQWKNSCKDADMQEDDMSMPAPAVNPLHSEFSEVKKGKKSKKKMKAVDSRDLGFTVTAPADRINVGERDYGTTQ